MTRNIFTPNEKYFVSLLLAFLTAIIPLNALALAGKVQFVLGQVHLVTLNGEELQIKRGMGVNNGDKIVTEEKGQVMIRMTDKSKISVRPNSTMIIRDYRYAKNSKTDKAHYELLVGTFRSVTGAIGKKNKKAFKLKMPVGTMGIRGTDFVARYSTEGFFVDVNSGGVRISNRNGVVDVDPGNFGHIATESSAPTLVEDLPDDMVVIDKPGDDENSIPSPEQEMVALAIKRGEDSRLVINELIQASLPTNDIVSGAAAVGVDETEVIEQLIDTAPDAEPVMEQLMKSMPQHSGDIVTIGIAKNKVNVEQATKIIKSSGGSEDQIKSSIALGKLLAPPPDAQQTQDSNEGSPNQKSKPGNFGNKPPANVPNQPAPGVIKPDPQLIPGGGTGGGEDASPS